MKRYLLFAGHDYYPNGGWSDFHNDFNDLEQAKEMALDLLSKHSYDWTQVVDTTIGRQV